jgi:hypothetical protein
MKQALLEVDAILSCVVADLSMPTADATKARAEINLARDKILDLAQGIEEAQRN